MTSLRCSSKLTESTIKGHINDNEGSLKTVETTEVSATNTQTTLAARADTQMTVPKNKLVTKKQNTVKTKQACNSRHT